MPLDWSVEGVSRSPKGNELDEWLDDETSWFREESSGMLFVLSQIFNCNSCVLCIVGKPCAVLLRDRRQSARPSDGGGRGGGGGGGAGGCTCLAQ